MKLAILGGGGLRTPMFLQALLLRSQSLHLTDLVLMDVDAEALRLMADLTRAAEEQCSSTVRIRRTTDPREALEGADFVITTFRVGGIEARVIDERVPLELGVLGQETTGPGGFAMGMRTVPVLLAYLRLMEDLCPAAWLINFANPAGMLAEAAIRVAGWERAVGICDAPHQMRRVAADFLGASPDDIDLDYFGLNHLGWLRGAVWQGVNRVPEFLQLLAGGMKLPGLPFPPEWLLSLGLIPNEYLYYYYCSREAVDNILRAGRTRAERIRDLNAQLLQDLRRYRAEEDSAGMVTAYRDYLHTRGLSYMVAESAGSHNLGELPPGSAEALATEGYPGVALAVMEGLQSETFRQVVVNVPNRGAVPGMGEGEVVEIPVRIGRGEIRRQAIDPIPSHCLGLMQQVKAYEQLTIAAASEGSYRKAVQALTLHPLVADYGKARAILAGYRERHGVWFPNLR
jgi:6-phospho-beta-glucosidase